MTFNDILARLKAEVFTPLRVIMNSGATCEVRHPDFVFVTATVVYIFPMADADQAPENTPVVCSIRNIAALEPLRGRAA